MAGIQQQEFFDPVTGGVIPGGFTPAAGGKFAFTPTGGTDTTITRAPGGATSYTIGPEHAAAAAKFGLKEGDSIDTSNPAFGQIFPSYNQSSIFDYGPLAIGSAFLGETAFPALLSSVAGAQGAGAGAGFLDESAGLSMAPADFGGVGDLSGALASPSSVSSFLQGIPEAVPGTTLPIGGTELDITAPGAIDAAAASGNLISPQGVTPDVTQAGGAVSPAETGVAPGTTIPGIPQPSAPLPVSPSTPATPPVPGVSPPGVPPPAVTGNSPFSSVSNFTDFLKNTLKENKNLLLPGAALAASALKKTPGADPNITALARDLQARSGALQGQADAMISAEMSGQLPPGAEANVNNALQDTKNSIKAKYAQLGMSGSTAEAQELASADSRAEAMKFDLAQQVTQTGLQAAGLSGQQLGEASQLYQILMNQELASDSALRNALATFAGAAAMSSGTKK